MVANAASFHLGPVVDLIVLLDFLLVGALVGAVLELVVALPLVVGLRRYGWRWVNWGTLAVIGFLTGALPIAWLVSTSTAGIAQLSDPQTLLSVAAFGLAGVAGAMTFGRIAGRPAGG